MKVILSEIETALKEAIVDRNLSMASQLFEDWRELMEARTQKEEAEKRESKVAERFGTRSRGPQSAKGWKGRIGWEEVTPGAVKYAYLLVTGLLRKHILKSSESLKIRVVPTGRVFETGIYWRNKHLRERPAIKEFYEVAGVKAGDFIALEEVAPNEWTLDKCAPPGADRNGE